MDRAWAAMGVEQDAAELRMGGDELVKRREDRGRFNVEFALEAHESQQVPR